MPNLLLLLVQIAAIIIVARLVGFAFRTINQPQVIGELVAGILLGPSLLGWLAPEVSSVLFPSDSLGFLNAISQLGILVFMFLVGLKLEPSKLKGHSRAAFVISQCSILLPFLMGAALAVYFYPRLTDGRVTFTGFALFMGAGMCVTAFPVLARILAEGNLSRTRAGSLAIACAAINDVTAWCILAAVVILVRSSELASSLWLTVVGSGIFVAVMVFGLRPILHRLEARARETGKVTQNVLAVILVLMLISASVTEWLGIHALFGAFLLGAVMPKDGEFIAGVVQRLEDVTLVFLLPLFFAFSGLRTSIALVSGAEMWAYCGLILAVAIAGKYAGSAVSAYFMGISWKEASAIGILMNTRGLMELIILNVGLDIGIISPTVFAMMIIMALTTTFMTAPLLRWTYQPAYEPLPVEPSAERELSLH
ncbi:cation:proton antiporter domain-containing protein [Candidatus Nitrospira bockiana]